MLNDENAHAKAEQRKEQALWYAFGREDAGDTKDPFSFSRHHYRQAFAYYKERVCFLPSIQDAYNQFQNTTEQTTSQYDGPILT